MKRKSLSILTIFLIPGLLAVITAITLLNDKTKTNPASDLPSSYKGCTSVKWDKKQINELMCRLTFDQKDSLYTRCLESGGENFEKWYSRSRQSIRGSEHCEINYYNHQFNDFPGNYRDCMDNFHKFFFPGESTSPNICSIKISTRAVHKDTLPGLLGLIDLCVKKGGSLKHFEATGETSCSLSFAAKENP